MHDPWSWLGLFAAVVVVLVLARARVLSRVALGGRTLRQLGAQPWWVWLIAAIVAYIAPSVGYGLALMAARSGADDLGSKALATAIAYAGALLATISVAMLMRRSAPSAGLSVKLKDSWIGAGCLLVSLPLVYASSVVSTSVYEIVTRSTIHEPIAHDMLKTIVSSRESAAAWALAGLAVIAAPIHEELLYRGFLQSAAFRLTGRPWPSIIATSAVFALGHLSAGVPSYAIASLFMLSLCLGFTFEKTRRIGVPIAMHMLFNAANIALAMLSA